MANGRIIFTNPLLADTDGDGISDFDEVGGLPAQYNMIIGEERLRRILIHPISDPLNAGEAGRQLNENYIFVDDFDYLPYNEEDYERIYRENTGEMDFYGQEVLGRRNIWHSNPDELTDRERENIINKLTIQVILAENSHPYASTFLYQYLFNVQELRMYNATKILAETAKTLNPDVDNLNNMKIDVYNIVSAGVDYLKPGEKIIIALSPEMKGCGLNYGYDHLQLLLAIGKADTATVAEISYDGESYHMKLRYYIFDYYDWDKTDNMHFGLVSAKEMYQLCQTGWAMFYENWGVHTMVIDWDVPERMDGENEIDYRARMINDAVIFFDNWMKSLGYLSGEWNRECDFMFYYKNI